MVLTLKPSSIAPGVGGSQASCTAQAVPDLAIACCGSEPIRGLPIGYVCPLAAWNGTRFERFSVQARLSVSFSRSSSRANNLEFGWRTTAVTISS